MAVLAGEPLRHLASREPRMSGFRYRFFLFFVLGAVAAFSKENPWIPDSVLGAPFEIRQIDLGADSDGPLVATLIRLAPVGRTSRAVIYLHGFNDYFFQKEMAERFVSAGYAFFAVDMHKYGRSYRPGQRRGGLRDIRDYYPELDSAFAVIRRAGYTSVALIGHSTGGLIAALYAEDRRFHLPMCAVILNSPFLDMNYPKILEKTLIPGLSYLAAYCPGCEIPIFLNSPYYVESLHRSYRGEWNFRLDWKKRKSIPIDFGWLHAIHQAQLRVQAGLHIPCPVFVMHSDTSFQSFSWNEEYRTSDAVLDVHDIEQYGARLGPRVTLMTIHGGMHDLVLSRKPVRDRVYREMLLFLDAVNEPLAVPGNRLHGRRTNTLPEKTTSHVRPVRM